MTRGNSSNKFSTSPSLYVSSSPCRQKCQKAVQDKGHSASFLSRSNRNLYSDWVTSLSKIFSLKQQTPIFDKWRSVNKMLMETAIAYFIGEGREERSRYFSRCRTQLSTHPTLLIKHLICVVRTATSQVHLERLHFSSPSTTAIWISSISYIP